LIADQENEESVEEEIRESETDEVPDETIYVTSVQIQKETASISNKIMELKQETLQLLDIYNLCIDDKLKSKKNERAEKLFSGEDNIRNTICE